MENHIYNWLVKNGTIQIQKQKDCISLQIDYEKGEYCLLTHSDANEISDLLANLSQEIWEDPSYQKKPYTGQIFKHHGNEYYWDTETSQIFIKYNEIKNAIEIKYIGNRRINLEIN
ncbi:hypothetical protein, partial [Kaistella sp.]|uniref:hypothetical protein n=1 Tax=Kaistella sp. TaxID=2782235 RepID=UPI003C69E24D